MVKVAICGGSGYTGAELLRILAQHPAVQVTSVTSERSAGKRVTDIFPHLVKYSGMTFEPMDTARLVSRAELFFMALPHAESQEAVDYFFKKGKKVIAFKFRRREGYHRKRGIRPHHTVLKIKEIVVK